MTLTRKNLMIDQEALSALAERRGLSESAAAREAIAHSLSAMEIADAVRELHAAGGIDDVFGRLSADWEAELGVAATTRRST